MAVKMENCWTSGICGVIQELYEHFPKDTFKTSQMIEEKSFPIISN